MLKQNFFLVTVKLIEYIFSTVEVCSNPYIGPFPRIKMSFFYYQCVKKNSSTPEINTL